MNEVSAIWIAKCVMDSRLGSQVFAGWLYMSEINRLTEQLLKIAELVSDSQSQ